MIGIIPKFQQNTQAKNSISYEIIIFEIHYSIICKALTLEKNYYFLTSANFISKIVRKRIFEIQRQEVQDWFEIFRY